MLYQANFAGRGGISYPHAKDRINSSDEDEDAEVISLLMMGTTEPIIAEAPSPTMKDIFDDLHQEGHQISTAAPTEGERVEPEATAAEEVIIGRGHEGGA